jgi:hypothetical protein
LVVRELERLLHFNRVLVRIGGVLVQFCDI